MCLMAPATLSVIKKTAPCLKLSLKQHQKSFAQTVTTFSSFLSVLCRLHYPSCRCPPAGLQADFKTWTVHLFCSHTTGNIVWPLQHKQNY